MEIKVKHNQHVHRHTTDLSACLTFNFNLLLTFTCTLCMYVGRSDQRTFLYLPTQIHFPIGGERVMWWIKTHQLPIACVASIPVQRAFLHSGHM